MNSDDILIIVLIKHMKWTFIHEENEFSFVNQSTSLNFIKSVISKLRNF